MNRSAITPTDQGLDLTEYLFTGLQIGNTDLADSCVWVPPQGEPERRFPCYPAPGDLP